MRFIKTRIKRNFFSFNTKSCQACHTFSRRLAEPVGAEAGAQGQTGAGKLDPAIVGGNRQYRADFIDIETEYLAHREDAGHGFRQAIETGFEDFPEALVSRPCPGRQTRIVRPVLAAFKWASRSASFSTSTATRSRTRRRSASTILSLTITQLRNALEAKLSRPCRAAVSALWTASSACARWRDCVSAKRSI